MLGWVQPYTGRREGAAWLPGGGGHPATSGVPGLLAWDPAGPGRGSGDTVTLSGQRRGRCSGRRDLSQSCSLPPSPIPPATEVYPRACQLLGAGEDPLAPGASQEPVTEVRSDGGCPVQLHSPM